MNPQSISSSGRGRGLRLIMALALAAAYLLASTPAQAAQLFWHGPLGVGGTAASSGTNLSGTWNLTDPLFHGAFGNVIWGDESDGSSWGSTDTVAFVRGTASNGGYGDGDYFNVYLTSTAPITINSTGNGGSAAESAIQINGANLIGGALILKGSRANNTIWVAEDMRNGATTGRTYAEISASITATNGFRIARSHDFGNKTVVMLTGTNHTGSGARIDVTFLTLRADEGIGLPTEANLFVDLGILGNVAPDAVFTRSTGTGAGQVQFSRIGGFSAFTGTFTIAMTATATGTYGEGHELEGQTYQYTYLETFKLNSTFGFNTAGGNGNGDTMEGGFSVFSGSGKLHFTNNIDLNGATRTLCFGGNPNSNQDWVEISGAIVNGGSSGGLNLYSELNASAIPSIVVLSSTASSFNGPVKITGHYNPNSQPFIISVAKIGSHTGTGIFDEGVEVGAPNPNTSALGAPTTASNSKISLQYYATLRYTGTGETTNRIIEGVSRNDIMAPPAIQNDGSGGLHFSEAFRYNTGGSAVPMVLKGAYSGTNTFKGIITTNAANASLTVAGAGTWELLGVANHTGVTRVHGAHLLVNMGAGAGFGTLTPAVTGSDAAPAYFSTAGGLTLTGGLFTVKGSNGGVNEQRMGVLSTQLGNRITLDNNKGSGVTLRFNSFTGSAGSTLLVDASSSAGNQVIFNTSGKNTSIGFYTRVLIKDNAGNYGFATDDGNGTALRYYNDQTANVMGATPNSNGAFSTYNSVYSSSNTLNITANSLVGALIIDTTKPGSTGTSLNLGTYNLSVSSGALLYRGDVDYLITGGRFSPGSGAVAGAAGGELIVHQLGTGVLEINSLTGSGAAALTKNGAGILALTGTNINTGATSINEGILRAQDGVGLSSSSLLSINNGVFESSGTFSRVLGQTGGAAGANVRLTGDRSGFSAFGDDLTVALKNGTGGTAQLVWESGSNNAVAWDTAQYHWFNPNVFVLNEWTADKKLILENSIDLVGGMRQIEVAASGTDAAGTRAKWDSAYAEIKGVISGGVPSAVGDGLEAGLTKLGAGRLVLSASNTYKGDTVVKEGRLDVGLAVRVGGTGALTGAVNGSLDSKLVAVKAGAALGGAGKIKGDLKFEGTGALNAEFHVDFGLAMDHGKFMSVGGALTLTNVRLDFGDTFAGFAVGQEYTILSSVGAALGNFGDVYALIGGIQTKLGNSSLFTYAGDQYQVVNDGKNLIVQRYDSDVIPEPSTWALLIGGLGALALLRRRKS